MAARHLAQFGYIPTVYYPKPELSKALYLKQLNQCRACDIDVIEGFHVDEWSQLKEKLAYDSPDSFSIIIDAMFGFSFKTDGIRKPFTKIIYDLKEI